MREEEYSSSKEDETPKKGVRWVVLLSITKLMNDNIIIYQTCMNTYIWRCSGSHDQLQHDLILSTSGKFRKMDTHQLKIMPILQ